MKKKIEKLLAVIAILICLALIFYLNLFKLDGDDPFSMRNIVQVSLLFIVGIGGWLIFEKLMDKYSKKILDEYEKKEP